LPAREGAVEKKPLQARASLSILATLLLLCGLSWQLRYADSNQGSRSSASSDNEYREERARMVRDQIEAMGIRDARVLAAMRKVPRHLFVPPDEQPFAYADTPLPIGYDQTISQPYVVAFMTEALEPKPQDRVLEIGTGSGYQAAVLAELVREVYTMEIVEPLAKQAEQRLRQMGYANVHARHGDGYRGWPEAAPFDGIIVTAAPDHVPAPLVEQLREGGRLVLPLGRWDQNLIRLRKTPKGITRESLLPVRFVPMTGEAEKPGVH
jgi:protein-L-isoaspartate(D-aspartate) O-methyltransferase